MPKVDYSLYDDDDGKPLQPREPNVGYHDNVVYGKPHDNTKGDQCDDIHGPVRLGSSNGHDHHPVENLKHNWLEKVLLQYREVMFTTLEEHHADIVHEVTQRLQDRDRLDAADISIRLPFQKGNSKLRTSHSTSRYEVDDAAASDMEVHSNRLSNWNSAVGQLEAAADGLRATYGQQGSGTCTSRFDELIDSMEAEKTKQNDTDIGSDLARNGERREIVVEVAMAVVIVVNVVAIAASKQYDSFDLAHYVIGFPNSAPAASTWPGGSTLFNVLELAFGCAFIMEVFVMIGLQRLRYFKSWWHLFDMSVSAAWLFGIIGDAFVTMNPTILRVLKLMRLVRLLRLIKMFSLFDSLFLLIRTMVASCSALMWSALLLLLVTLLVAMLVEEFLEAYMTNNSVPLELRTEVWKQWGSVSRAVATMFEVTLGNWGPPCRLLQNHVSEWWALFFVSYKVIVGFTVVQVITSVFVQQTFKVVAQDEEIVEKVRERARAANILFLSRLFEHIDTSGDGVISKAEFNECVSNPKVVSYFRAIDIEQEEISRLFGVISTGHGDVEYEKFVAGMTGTKGPARSLDLMALSTTTTRIERSLGDLRRLLLLTEGGQVRFRSC